MVVVTLHCSSAKSVPWNAAYCQNSCVHLFHGQSGSDWFIRLHPPATNRCIFCVHWLPFISQRPIVMNAYLGYLWKNAPVVGGHWLTWLRQDRLLTKNEVEVYIVVARSVLYALPSDVFILWHVCVLYSCRQLSSQVAPLSPQKSTSMKFQFHAVTCWLVE